jgi:hypothetical protein
MDLTNDFLWWGIFYFKVGVIASIVGATAVSLPHLAALIVLLWRK